MFACMEIIEYLEHKMHVGPSAIDEVMSVNKNAAAESSKLSQLEEFKRACRCLSVWQ
jgi:hypothetical protein